jgi:hypothetical protein
MSGGNGGKTSGENSDKKSAVAVEDTTPVRVAIIGAGIAGLTAAWELRARGFEVQVFEQSANLGGKLGANPMRLPLKATLQAEFPEPVNDIDPKEMRARVERRFGSPIEWPVRLRADRSLSESEVEALSRDLDDPDAFPAWLQWTVDRWFLTRKDRMTRKRDRGKDDDISEELELRRSQPPTFTAERIRHASSGKTAPPWDESARYWQITDPKRNARYRISVRKRFNETWILDISDGERHEHCYHMYLNWYVNFWRLMKEIGLDRSTHFEERDHYLHMHPGSTPMKRRTRKLKKLGRTEQWAENMLAGITTLPDSFLVLYSALDLVSEPLDPARYLDRVSVHGFLSSRWYASEESLKIHEHLLLRAFAVPAYYSSAYAYQKHLAFTLADPDPALWVLKSNVDGTLFEMLAEKLQTPDGVTKIPCRIHRGMKVSCFGFDKAQGRVRELVFRPSDTRWPRSNNDGERQDDSAGPEQRSEFEPDYVIMAVPPLALAGIVSDLRDRLPGMAAVRKLQSGVTAVLDLYFNRKLEGIPEHHVVLRDSRYAISFFDNSQLWLREKPSAGGPPMPDKTAPTHLSVAVTDFYRIEGMTKDDAAREILADLRRFLPFDVEQDVDFSRTYLQMNVNEPLFLNEVGSEPWRPETVTEIPNLFLAGDFVANDIDVICVEGAVLSGLNAARAVQAQLRTDKPQLPPSASYFDEIKVLMPKTLPRANAEAMKAILAPYLPAAKAASSTLEMRRHPERALSPRDMRASADAMFAIPGNAASSALGLYAGAAQWMADLPLHKSSND